MVGSALTAIAMVEIHGGLGWAGWAQLAGLCACYNIVVCASP